MTKVKICKLCRQLQLFDLGGCVSCVMAEANAKRRQRFLINSKMTYKIL